MTLHILRTQQELDDRHESVCGNGRHDMPIAMQLEQDAPWIPQMYLPTGQRRTKVDVDVPDGVGAECGCRSESHQGTDLLAVDLVHDPGGDEMSGSKSHEPAHAEEERHMEHELVGHAVVDDKGDDDAEDDDCIAALNMRRFLESVDLMEDGANTEMHGEFIGCNIRLVFSILLNSRPESGLHICV